ncbi:14622_t:CDS:1, partial [Racocetra fulgida]
LIKTVSDKPFSLPAVSDDSSGYKELIKLEGRWIKKRKPEEELDFEFKQITFTKIEITEYYKELVLKKLQMNAIIDDIYKIEHSQKIDGSLPLYNIIINDQLQLKKNELGKTFKESIESFTGKKIGLDLSIWETAFGMVYLETVFSDYYNKWKHVYEKAKEWIDDKLDLFKITFEQLKGTCMNHLIELCMKFYNKPMIIHTFEIDDDKMEPVYRTLKVQNDINCLLKSILENDSIVSVNSGKFKITFDDKTIETLKYYIDAWGARCFDKEVLVSFFAITFLNTFLKDDNISKSKRESARNRIHDKVQNTELAKSITRACEQYLRKQVYDFFTENNLMIID